MIKITMPMEHDTDTHTSTSAKSHLISLNNELNITYAMVSLIAPSVSCDRKHAIDLYIPKTNIPSNAMYKPNLSVISNAHETIVSVYMSHINLMQSQM